MRVLSLLAVAVLAVAAGFAVKSLIETRPRHVQAVGASASDSDGDLGRVILHADARVTPAMENRLLLPGSRFRYSFTITNRSDTTIRHVVVRSARVTSPGTGDALSVVSVSDPSCWSARELECIFARLGPGETRTVRVVAGASRGYRPGDRLTIHTFLGRFGRPVGGSVPMDVVGPVQATVGRFS